MSVKVTTGIENMEVMSQGGLDPVPPFPQWNALGIYPYHYWSGHYRKAGRRDYRFIYLENRYLRIGFNLELGGRTWFIFDKLANRHAINYANGVYSYFGGFAKNYTCGGMEINYPVAHSPTTRLPREHRVVQNADGSASVIISEYEQRWRTRWSVTYTLHPDSTCLELMPRIYNRTPLEARYMYWSNCGMPCNDDTEFIFPEDAGSMHGAWTETFSWPMWQRLNQAWWKNTIEPLGLYMLDVSQGYLGYYDHGQNAGLAHWADVSDLPGKKYWSWGSALHSRTHLAQTHHPQAQTYGEVQAGRIVIQEHLDRFPPQCEQTWKEYWYPVRGTGRFHGAGVGGAVAINTPSGDFTGEKTLEIKVCGTRACKGATLNVVLPDGALHVQRLDVSPENVSVANVKLSQALKRSDKVFALLTADNGEMLCRAQRGEINPRDSWLELHDAPAPEKQTAEVLYHKAMAIERDWNKYDTRKDFEAVLVEDPGHSPTLLELGKLATERGEYEVAADYLRKAMRRDEDSFEIRYHLGNALEFAGRTEEAMRAYELCARYDYESRSRWRLAVIYARQSFLHDALRHITRACEVAPRLTKLKAMQAGILRHMKSPLAKEAIEAALAIDADDPYAVAERFLQTGDKKIVAELLDAVDGYEPPILEAAFDFLDAGMPADALKVVEIIPSPGALALLLKAHLLDTLGKQDESRQAMDLALKADCTNVYPWRLEMMAILKWVIDTLPDHPRARMYLGNMLMARWRDKEAFEQWQKAQQLGEQYHIMYVSMGEYCQHVLKDNKLALEYYQKAGDLAVDSLAAAIPLMNLLVATGKHKELKSELDRRGDHVANSVRLGYFEAKLLLDKKEYAAFDAFVEKCDYGDNWCLPSPADLLYDRHVNEAFELMAKGQYERAAQLLDKACDVPKNLQRYDTNRHDSWKYGKRERTLYHMACCYEKLNKPDMVKKCFDELLSYENAFGWERGWQFRAWQGRYFQALALKKMGQTVIARAMFDAMEVIGKQNKALPIAARKMLLQFADRGRHASEENIDPMLVKVEIAATAEL